jgi:hypothetical protein
MVSKEDGIAEITTASTLGCEIFGLDACLSEDSAQRSFRHITRVVRDRGVAISGGAYHPLRGN